jgi:hypothetical protein
MKLSHERATGPSGVAILDVGFEFLDQFVRINPFGDGAYSFSDLLHIFSPYDELVFAYNLL